MPELPEVETTCRGIEPHLINQTINKVIIREKRLRWPVNTALKKQLYLQPILKVSRRAKYILLHLPKGFLIIHLGMSGTLRLLSQHTPIKKHDHFDCYLTNGLLLRFNDPRRFGALLWTAELKTHQLFHHLGPEPLEREFTARYLYTEAQRHRSPVKSFLMTIVLSLGWEIFMLMKACLPPKFPLFYQQINFLLSKLKPFVVPLKKF